MKYGIMIILTILIMMILIEIKQDVEQISMQGHHITEIEQIEREVQ